jgi:hypothetical protein
MEHFLEGQLRALSTSKPKDSQAEKTASRSSCILPGGGDSSRHQYCIEKLANLTIELAKNGLKSKILPSAMEASNNGIVSNDERGRGNDESKSNKEAKNEDETDKIKKNNRVQKTNAACLSSIYLESPISLSMT